nr:PQQ-binding-like beta-propeller repeat protein [Phytoactinopolyspora mesophila]
MIDHPRDTDLAGNGIVLQSHGRNLAVTDSSTGQTTWARDQRGISYGTLSFGDRLAMAQVPENQALTVATVDVTDGEVLACAQIGEAVENPGYRVRQAAGAAVGDDSVALIQRQPGDQFGLFMVDVREGEIRWQRTVELDTMPELVDGAGDALVASQVPPGSTEAWSFTVDRRDNYPPEMLRLHAFSLADGTPIWDFGLDHDAGEQHFVHQVIGTTSERVVVRASRFDESSETIENHVIGLDATTGEPRWSHQLPPSPFDSYSEGRVFGDVVIVAETDDDPDSLYGSLVGYHASTGDQLWQTENVTSSLERGALLDDTAVLPGLSRRGILTIDLQSGDTSTAFDGLDVSEIIVDDTTLGVTFFFHGDPTLILYDRAG